MKSFGRILGAGVSALSLALVVSAAQAQQPKPTPAKKEFVTAYNAGLAALQASNWPVAIAQMDAAEPFVNAEQQKCSVAQVRLSAGAQSNNKPVMIKGLETMVTCPNPDPKALANLREALTKAYSETPGSEDKGEELVKSHMSESTGWSLNWAANRALEKKDYDGAIAFADAGIASIKASGQKPPAAFYNIKINAMIGQNKQTELYPVIEEVAGYYPQERYIRPLIDRAKNDAKYDRKVIGLDTYRAMIAAGSKLTNEEQAFMADLALQRGLAIEGEKAMTPVAGWIGGADDKNGAYNKKTWATLQTNAKADREGGLAQSEKEAAKAPNGNLYVATGESYFGMDDYGKAATLIQQGLDKGGLKPEDEALARLHLGIAQFKSGKKEEARATWGSIKSDTGAESLARAWIALSKA